ncbi:MAG: hypothetical protein EOO20_27270 [Chryseobacterium sp.]|nr:MAG: hypothetical protein EOO20_27270 [Chryseobacterium sp.]
MLATDFLLTYSTIYNERFLPAKKVYEKYIKIYKALMPGLNAEPNSELRYFKLISFYMKWHTDVINNLSDNDAIIDVKSRKRTLKL